MAIVTNISVGGILDKIDNTKTPTDGQGLIYNATSGKWEPGSVGGGGEASFTQEVFAIPGTYSWQCPAGVTSIKLLVIGPGGTTGDASSGAGGGGIAIHNSYAVTAGTLYPIRVGSPNISSHFNNAVIGYSGGPGYYNPSGEGIGGAGGSGLGGETVITGGVGGKGDIYSATAGGASGTGGGGAHAAMPNSQNGSYGGLGTKGGGGGGGGARTTTTSGNSFFGGGGGSGGTYGGNGGSGGNAVWSPGNQATAYAGNPGSSGIFGGSGGAGGSAYNTSTNVFSGGGGGGAPGGGGGGSTAANAGIPNGYGAPGLVVIRSSTDTDFT